MAGTAAWNKLLPLEKHPCTGKKIPVGAELEGREKENQLRGMKGGCLAEGRGESRLDKCLGCTRQCFQSCICCNNSIPECKHGRAGSEYRWASWLCGQPEKNPSHLDLQKSPQPPAGTTGTCGDIQLNSGQEGKSRSGILGFGGCRNGATGSPDLGEVWDRSRAVGLGVTT